MEDLLGESLGRQEIEKAYLHYEALCDHSYEFNCVVCGYHPSILIWDTFRKATFRYAGIIVTKHSYPLKNQIILYDTNEG